jgi:hypothetical protein
MMDVFDRIRAKFTQYMKKRYSFLTLLLVLCKISFAGGGYTLSNKIYYISTKTNGFYDDGVLNLKMFELTGTRQISNAILNWRIITSENVDYFEIERSINNGAYITIAAIHQSVYLNELQSLNYTDNIYGIAAEKLMYRVKIISKSNRSKYSNVSVIHQGQLKRQLSIAPNQSNDYVNIGFLSPKDATVQIRVLDSEGKKVYVQKQPVYKGNNTIKLINLNTYPEGQYLIQIILNGEITSGKLMLFTN